MEFWQSKPYTLLCGSIGVAGLPVFFFDSLYDLSNHQSLPNEELFWNPLFAIEGGRGLLSKEQNTEPSIAKLCTNTVCDRFSIQNCEKNQLHNFIPNCCRWCLRHTS